VGRGGELAFGDLGGPDDLGTVSDDLGALLDDRDTLLGDRGRPLEDRGKPLSNRGREKRTAERQASVSKALMYSTAYCVYQELNIETSSVAYNPDRDIQANDCGYL
jgi:hypothetical protein